MTKHIPRIISALVGLALVAAGIYLLVTGGHEIVGTAILTGGLGTLGLPAALPLRATPERPRRMPPSSGAGLALIIVAAACSVLTSGCQSAAAAGPIAITARDVTCRGGRVVCRLVDRVCRGTGGPWVVPRSAEEIASDAASRLTRAEPDDPEGEGEGAGE